MDQDRLDKVIKGVTYRQLLDLIGIGLNRSVMQMDLKEVEIEINRINQNVGEMGEVVQEMIKGGEGEREWVRKEIREVKKEVKEMGEKNGEF